MSARSFPYTTTNGHIIGIVMKELVRRAIVEIDKYSFAHEVIPKKGLSRKDDFKTTGDNKAQKSYLRSLGECFPDLGIVAEEDDVFVARKHKGQLVYFTVDPLDGTRAYVRGASHGVGTMIALVHGQRIVAAYVGDANTREIYGYRPDSDAVRRISKYEVSRKLRINPRRPLSRQYILLREEPAVHSKIAQRLITNVSKGGAFKGLEVTGGSIGIAIARLWKGEVGAALLQAGVQAPWDWAPVVGISKKLGFRFFYLVKDEIREFEPLLSMKSYRTGHEMLIVHASRAPELARWLRGFKKRP